MVSYRLLLMDEHDWSYCERNKHFVLSTVTQKTNFRIEGSLFGMIIIFTTQLPCETASTLEGLGIVWDECYYQLENEMELKRLHTK